MNTLFDSAGLAIVAYADVLANGSTPLVNSGLTVTKAAAPALGQYAITLPRGKAQVAAPGEAAPRDLVFVQAIQTPLDNSLLTAKVDPTATVNSDGSATFNVAIVNGTTFADGAFDILILRTILSTPANPTGPT